MEKDVFFKKLTLVLEEFDNFREAPLQGFLDEFYAASEIYYADVIQNERKKAVKEYLIQQLKKLEN